MRTIFALIVVALTAQSCTILSEEDYVRKYRSEYKIDFDFTVSEKENALTYEISLQNMSGGKNLQEVTLLVDAFDANDKVIWNKQLEFDVTGVGNYATETRQFRDEFEAAPQVAGLSVYLAPDDEGSDYKNYTEFMRIAR